MKILVFVPCSRRIEPSLNSICALNTRGHDAVFEWAFEGDQPDRTRWENVTHKYQTARRMALEGEYDALLCIEDDIVVPPDALHRLIDTGADIAYGLVTWRQQPHQWSAAIVTGPGDGDHETYDQRPDAMRASWGRVIDVVGCGLFCTLIRRNVLEALPFELRGWRCCDFYHAFDAMKAGFTQKCDTRVLCGHVMEQVGDRWRVVYPDADRRYRYEEMA